MDGLEDAQSRGYDLNISIAFILSDKHTQFNLYILFVYI